MSQGDAYVNVPAVTTSDGILMGGGEIRLIVGFQPLMVISPTASRIRCCMQVYACELMWTCLVWAERSTPDSFGVPSRRFNSVTGVRKESLRPFMALIDLFTIAMRHDFEDVILKQRKTHKNDLDVKKHCTDCADPYTIESSRSKYILHAKLNTDLEGLKFSLVLLYDSDLY